MATRSMPMMCCSPSACISMKKYMHPNAIFCFLMANLFLCAKQIRKPSSFNSPSPMAWRKGCLMDGRSCRSISSKSLTRKGRLPNSGRSRRGQTSGPGFEYNFLFFNLSDPTEKTPAEIVQRQKWFREAKFRQAVSAAIDREAIVRLVYQGRGAPLWGLVTPGNRRWQDEKLPHPPRSLDRARTLLKEAGFSWSNGPVGETALFDSDGKPVEFSILTSSSNADRAKMAALIQDDLKQLGMRVQVVPLEFRSLLDRVTQTKDYDACVMGIASFDADPNSDINVWLSSGGTHLWNPSQAHSATPWEAEIDRLINEQMYARTFEQRKKLYDRAQEILWDYQPMIFLASPDIL